jgi:hypothetical protein
MFTDLADLTESHQCSQAQILLIDRFEKLLVLSGNGLIFKSANGNMSGFPKAAANSIENPQKFCATAKVKKGTQAIKRPSKTIRS